MTNTTLLRENSPDLAGTLRFPGRTWACPPLGLNALIYSGQRARRSVSGLPKASCRPCSSWPASITGRTDQRLIWYTPTQYCHFDPMQLELGVKGCTAALYNMCIEPDGERDPLPVLLPAAGQSARQTPGKQSGITSLPSACANAGISPHVHFLQPAIRMRRWLPAGPRGRCHCAHPVSTSLMNRGTHEHT